MKDFNHPNVLRLLGTQRNIAPLGGRRGSANPLWATGEISGADKFYTLYNCEAIYNIGFFGNSLAVQWLGLGASTAGGPSSIPGQGTKILQAAQCGKK